MTATQHPQGVGRGCTADESATSTLHPQGVGRGCKSRRVGNNHAHPGRQRSRCPRRLPRQRGDRHLSHHPGVEHGRVGGRMGLTGPAQPVGRGTDHHRDAVGGRCRRHAARRAHLRRAGDQLHRQPGSAADDPQPLQDRRRADALRSARRGTRGGDSRAVDLRRPVRRHGLSCHRLCAARRQLAAGSAGLCPDRAGGDTRRAHPGDSFFRWLPHLP
jgi:hypothetical protein